MINSILIHGLIHPAFHIQIIKLSTTTDASLESEKSLNTKLDDFYGHKYM